MSLKRNKFLLVGTGTYINRGCEAIVRGTVDIISRYFPDARFVLSSFGEKAVNSIRIEPDDRIEHREPRNPFIHRYDRAWWKYKILLRGFPQLLRHYQYGVQIEAAKKADCAFEIGGDNYSLDYGVPNLYVQLDRSLLATGKPLILWGASIGPFSGNPAIESMMKEHLSRFNLICARESETVEYLHSIGIEKNVRLVADPAFLMSPEKPVLSDELISFINRSPIGLNLSPMLGRYKKGSQENRWFEDAGECVKRLLNSDIAPILLVPHVMQEGNNDYDFMIEAIIKTQKKNDNVKILPSNLSAAEYKWVISKMRSFIGARTHSTIAALSCRVPTISIGYSMKARGINKDIFGHLDWMISINDLNPDLLIAKINDVLYDEKSIRLELEKKIPEIEDRAISAAGYIEKVIYEV